jgi:hypothetical protein
MPVELSLGRRTPAVIIIARVESVLGCPVIHLNLPLAELEPTGSVQLDVETGTVRQND